MSQNLTVKDDNLPTVPGIGMGGLVMCPLFKGPCLKNGCEMWVELKTGQQKVGRCAFAWLPILAIETRGAIDKLTGVAHNNLQSEVK